MNVTQSGMHSRSHPAAMARLVPAAMARLVPAGLRKDQGMRTNVSVHARSKNSELALGIQRAATSQTLSHVCMRREMR